MQEIKKLQKKTTLKNTYCLNVLMYLEGNLMVLIENIKDVKWKKKAKQYALWWALVPVLGWFVFGPYQACLHKSAIKEHFKRGTVYDISYDWNGNVIRKARELSPSSLSDRCDSSTLIPLRTFEAEKGGALNKDELIGKRENARNKVVGGDLFLALGIYIATERGLYKIKEDESKKTQ